ncbi:MAG TPA: hypothetical protein VKB15_12785 [Xanthobacteraceae bacterium]|nr:hypothetical protein [Xanthobacteraceae bacterium]
MRRAYRLIPIAAVLPLTLALAGCETSGIWDSANSVSDRFQDALADFSPFGTSKKPLPGERRAVFPEGVPGVQQGVPPELMRGNQQAEELQAQPEPQPASAAKGKTKKTATTAKTPARARPAAATSDPPEDEVWPPPPTR